MSTIDESINTNNNTKFVDKEEREKILEKSRKLEFNNKVAEQPILLPDHVFIKKFKDLGIDEILASVVDPASSAVGNALLSPELKNYILPFTGPAAEKFIFFARHMLEARGIYKTTHEKIRKPYKYYLKEGVKHGAGNLVKDIVYHDPIYTSLMYAGLILFPEVHPSVISFVDYLVSVPLAVGLDVIIDEKRHKKITKNIIKAGFQSEKYYEAKFDVLKEMDPTIVLDELINDFNLKRSGTVTYTDTYFDIESEGFSGRKISMRLRQREKRDYEKEDPSWIHKEEFSYDNKIASLQIVYTRVKEDKGNTKNPDQCRYFPAKKEKLYAILDPNTKSLEDITDNKILNIAKHRIISDSRKTITFDRTIARNNELAICTDKVMADRPYYRLELKVYKDTNILKQAMRYIMVNFPLAVEQTTHSKNDTWL
ncbi:MAG: hypothetical protein ACP5N1_06325 [Candidatus Woesearchaeota archaeon]